MNIPIHQRNQPYTAPYFRAEVFDHVNFLKFFASWIKPNNYVEYGIRSG